MQCATALLALVLFAGCQDDETRSAALPDRVSATRSAILSAARQGDYDALRPLIKQELFISEDRSDPVSGWRKLGEKPLETMEVLLQLSHQVRDQRGHALSVAPVWPRLQARRPVRGRAPCPSVDHERRRATRRDPARAGLHRAAARDPRGRPVVVLRPHSRPVAVGLAQMQSTEERLDRALHPRRLARQPGRADDFAEAWEAPRAPQGARRSGFLGSAALGDL